MYLQLSQLHTYLSLGKTVEQWLGSSQYDDYAIIKWVSINREPNGNYSVAYLEMFDEGNEDFLDVYAFSAVDPDFPEGKIETFSTYMDALEFSSRTYQCALDKFVNVFMVQEEYYQHKINSNRK